MGTGVGRGENRALEAAQQAISSPLLDNISISGASGVLINISGGADLTLGEVHQISEVIHDAVGEEAELIFGAVTDPAMQGEIRVTVIATGFDKQESKEKGVIQFPQRHGPAGRQSGAIQTSAAGGSSGVPGGARRVVGGAPQQAPHVAPPVVEPLTDMEIPTFIRRQMD
jgi:cell division protein FtsZ